MSKFKRMGHGDPVNLEMGQYTEPDLINADSVLHFACCDCGMVHTVVPVLVADNQVNLHFWSKPRSTAQLRRQRYGNLHTGVGKWKLTNEPP